MGQRRIVELALLVVAAAGVLFLCASTVLGWFAPSPGGALPDVEYANGTAQCPAGTYDGITTGNNDGKCAQTQSGPSSETLEYKCDDGKGNTAVVNCQANGGFGLCESTGSGNCGKFLQKK